VKLDPGRSPRLRHVASVIHEEVCGAGTPVAVGHDTKLNFNVMAGGKGMAASHVRANLKTETPVVVHRRIEIMNSEDQRPLEKAMLPDVLGARCRPKSEEVTV
jgi:hypothetical protein